MKKRFSVSSVLNLGSLLTFAAFPLLYMGVTNDSLMSTCAGLLLVVAAMLTPFAARICGKDCM